jgi:hypothetical protein
MKVYPPLQKANRPQRSSNVPREVCSNDSWIADHDFGYQIGSALPERTTNPTAPAARAKDLHGMAEARSKESERKSRFARALRGWEQVSKRLHEFEFPRALITRSRYHGFAQTHTFNRRWLEYLGLSLKDVQGWGWTAAIHPEDVASFLG